MADTDATSGETESDRDTVRSSEFDALLVRVGDFEWERSSEGDTDAGLEADLDFVAVTSLEDERVPLLLDGSTEGVVSRDTVGEPMVCEKDSLNVLVSIRESLSDVVPESCWLRDSVGERVLEREGPS